MIAAPAQDKEPVTEGPHLSDQQAMEKRIEDKLFPPQKEKPAAKAKPAEAKAPETAPETTDAAAPAESADAEPAAEETYEFEFGNSRYQVPKELEELHKGYLRQDDYTKKTMTAADRQKHADLLIEQAQKAQQLQHALQPKYEAVQQTQQLLKQYEQVDWNTWIANDPTAAQKGMLQWQVLKEQKAQREGELNQAAQQQMRAIQEVRQKLVDENTKVLQRDIKGWSADTDKAVRGWAEKTFGFSRSELDAVYDSRVMRMMHSAKQWHELQESKPQAQKQVAQVATLKPSATDGRNAKQGKEADLKRAVRVAKTDKERSQAVQALLEHRL